MGYPKPQDSIHIVHPMQSRANSFPRDIFLRSRHWVIHARPNGKPALWRCRDLIATEAEALEIEQYDKATMREKVIKDGP